MSRHVFYKHKRGHKRWNKNQFIDDRNEDGGGDHLRIVNTGFNRRDHGGTGRRSVPSEMIRRAVAMNLLPGHPDKSPGAPNSGLGIGEAWSRITVVFGAARPMNVIHEMVNTAFGTQLRFYNSLTEGRNAVMYAKIRQKQLSSYRKAIQNLRDPTDSKTLIGDITLVPEPRVPSAPSMLPNGSQELPVMLPDAWMDALRRCFLERFQSATRSLDLSSLHTDPSLLSQGLYLPLNRSVVVHTMVNILKENAAQLSLLSLANNRLTHMNAFSPLASTPVDSTPVTIERIDLSGNPLNGFPSLAGLRGIAGLSELDISDTPVAARFQQNDRNLAA